MEIQAVILAGGLGTRLRPLTLNIPKALIEIVNEPFLSYQLRLLKKNGIKKILLCAGYKNELIKRAFGSGKKYGVDLAYSVEKGKLLGTAGALKKAQRLLNSHFMVIYGDSYLPIDFQKVETAYRRSSKPALMTVFKNRDRLDKSNVRLRGDMVARYKKNSKEKMDYIDYGLTVLDRKLIEALPKNRVIQLEEVFEDLAASGRLAAFKVKEPFYEIGSPSGLKRFKNYILDSGA
jgi:N-acetyl-alpha-D-muramate 1-phosphate uridylyltransferase